VAATEEHIADLTMLLTDPTFAKSLGITPRRLCEAGAAIDLDVSVFYGDRPLTSRVAMHFQVVQQELPEESVYALLNDRTVVIPTLKNGMLDLTARLWLPNNLGYYPLALGRAYVSGDVGFYRGGLRVILAP
jgi:hypothetical protein